MIALATLAASVSLLVGQPVTIEVNTEAPGSWAGGAWVGYPVIDLGRDALTDAQQGGGRGLLMLLHEAGHVSGIVNEAEANCFALRNLPRFWLQTFGQGLDTWAADRFMHSDYYTAAGFMRAQSSVYQCPRYAPIWGWKA